MQCCIYQLTTHSAQSKIIFALIGYDLIKMFYLNRAIILRRISYLFLRRKIKKKREERKKRTKKNDNLYDFNGRIIENT